MSNTAWVKAAQNFWHALIHDSQKEVIDDLTPIVSWLTNKGGVDLLGLAIAYLTGASATISWADLIAQFLPVAEAAGKQLLADEVSILLNLAKAKLGIQKATA